MVDNINRLLGIGHAEVIEHDTIHTTVIQYLLQLIERANLDFDLQVQALLIEILMAAIDSVCDTTGKIYVIILEQNHIKQTDTVIAATTNLYGLLLEHTHTRCGFTGIKHTGVGTLQTLNILISHGGNTTHALHDVQHQTLGLKQRTDFS